jgi:hypothetical protein
MKLEIMTLYSQYIYFLLLYTVSNKYLCNLNNEIHEYNPRLHSNLYVPIVSHSGRWSPNWVHSARRPLNDLLYLPRVIMMMENLVEWRLAGETKLLRENLPQRHFVHHKSHLTSPGFELGPPRWEASN